MWSPAPRTATRSLKSMKEGIAMTSNIDSTAILTINSIKVKPFGYSRRMERSVLFWLS